MMEHSVRRRFYLEVVLGLAGLSLFGLTLAWNDWIELVFHVDPDAGIGALEFLVCFGLLAAAAVSFWLARAEWRRLPSPASSHR
jgi:hypothetical protein